MGDAGRQGRTAQPRLRRQRHGQRHDRGERRPRGRRQLLHGRGRDRPEHRGRRLRGAPPEHALRDPGRSDLPRARRAADAGAGHGPRRRRHQPCPRSCSTIRPAAAPASSCASSPIDPLPRARGSFRSPSRRSGTAGWRSIAAGSSRWGVLAPAATRTSATSVTWRFCRAWSTRTRTSSCPIFAIRFRHSGDFVTWIRGVVGARRQRPDAKSPEIMDGVDAAIRESIACGTAIVGDISNTLVTFEPAGGKRARRRRVLRTDPLRRRGGRAGRRGGGPSTRRAGARPMSYASVSRRTRRTRWRR